MKIPAKWPSSNITKTPWISLFLRFFSRSPPKKTPPTPFLCQIDRFGAAWRWIDFFDFCRRNIHDFVRRNRRFSRKGPKGPKGGSKTLKNFHPPTQLDQFSEKEKFFGFHGGSADPRCHFL